MQVPHPTQRNLFLQKRLGGGGEEYLFGGVDGGHDELDFLDLPGRYRWELKARMVPVGGRW